MNKPILLLFLLSACIGFLSSCVKDDITVAPDEKDDVTLTPHEEYEFEGEWLWIKTTSGWSPPLTPESLGFSLSLKIDLTTYTLLVNDAISSQWLYEFKTSVNSWGDTIEYIRLDSGKRYNLRVDSANLELSDDLFDGDTWYYVRK